MKLVDDGLAGCGVRFI